MLNIGSFELSLKKMHLFELHDTKSTFFFFLLRENQFLLYNLFVYLSGTKP